MYKKHMVVPANANWYALDWQFSHDDSGVTVTREPVIAWAVTINEQSNGKISTAVEPVIQDKLSSFYEGAIIRPDGAVCIRGKKHWDTLSDYVEDVRKRHHNNATTFMNKAEVVYAGN